MHEMSKRKENEPQGDDAATNQRRQFISMPMCKILFLLWQTGLHYAFLLQNKEQGAKINEEYK